MSTQTFLPEAVHAAFELKVAEFLLKPWETARAAAAVNGAGEGGTQVWLQGQGAGQGRSQV